MLATVLPGLRQVRAPLSAGFIWLVGLWFLVEPRWPELETSSVVASANRLLANLNILGQGVAISFLAYILGSFSVFLFSTPLAQSITTSMSYTGRLSGLSAAGRASLEQVARDGRQRIEASLALSGLQSAEVLQQTRPVEPMAEDTPRRNPLLRGAAKWEKRWRQFPFVEVDRENTMLTWIPPDTSAEAVEAEIAQRVLRDLPAVADAQLLGRETEVFSAVDRGHAEVDFRIALVPSVIALSISVGVAVNSSELMSAMLSPVIGGLAAAALMLDAARQRRAANELILSLMEHQRIIPPAISRAVSTATELADQAPGKEIVRRGENAVRAIHRAMEDVSRVGDSSVFVGPDAAQATRQAAAAECANLETLLSRYADSNMMTPTGDDVLRELDAALRVIEEFTERTVATGQYSQEDVDASNARLVAVQRDAAATLAEYGKRIRAVAAVAAAADSARSTTQSLAGRPPTDTPGGPG